MKRPSLIHFLAIMTEEALHIKASVNMKEKSIYDQHQMGFAREMAKGIVKEFEKEWKPRFPIQAYRLLSSDHFKIKFVGLDQNKQEIYKKVFESDSFGNLNFKIPLNQHRRQITALQIYEVSQEAGLELHLGTFIPLKIQNPKKIIICDFDKTLVDTKYSTTREVYNSLTRPLEYFPTINQSVEILKRYISEGYHPFILSASPHFYEEAMRDWLYKNQIYSAGIFLKDYRQVFSLLDYDLTPKDLKSQGMYKLNHLLDILLMTGVPDYLVLMGDNFESDPIIYSGLATFLKEHVDPWKFWKELRKFDAFQMNRKQNAQLLNKFYQLSNNLSAWRSRRSGSLQLKILIRKKLKEEDLQLPNRFDSIRHLLELYDGPNSIHLKEVAQTQDSTK
jgi:phosphatidate phosphatase APP1